MAKKKTVAKPFDPDKFVQPAEDITFDAPKHPASVAIRSEATQGVTDAGVGRLT